MLTAELVEGAVGLIDALGFKGIWRRHEPSVVYSRFLSMQSEIEGLICAFPSEKASINIQFLSDTVFVSALPTIPEHLDAACFYVCAVLSYIQWLGIRDDPIQSYRGYACIGNYFESDVFMIGPAIDEAAERMNVPDAGVIWTQDRLAKAAARHISSNQVLDDVSELGQAFSKLVLRGVVVPMKEIGDLDVDILNPFIWRPDEDAERWVSRLLSSFTTSNLHVAAKQRNTRNAFSSGI